MYRLLLFLICFGNIARAGNRDSSLFQSLNAERIHTNMGGMKLLGGWGLANTLTGIAGALTAKDPEYQHFHQMNAAWGIVNLGIAALGYMGARRELHQPVGNARALHLYESTKRMYLINAGLDGLYIATGVFLTEHARNAAPDDHDLYRGFGKSLILQGAGLLLFDAHMFLSHQRADGRWYKVLNGFCVRGDGIGWRYVIK